jgi:hypothetical protein
VGGEVTCGTSVSVASVADFPSAFPMTSFTTVLIY